MVHPRVKRRFNEASIPLVRTRPKGANSSVTPVICGKGFSNCARGVVLLVKKLCVFMSAHNAGFSLARLGKFVDRRKGFVTPPLSHESMAVFRIGPLHQYAAGTGFIFLLILTSAE